uniref:Uncharacterized protein n=1 Tax=Trepomonas sp. PC1 TaxID=1076344 RepID=A0A146K2L8_9EUKA|eukprot:JAP91132.1 Hypothetical protein TPC1_17342 [Trepomonas sp. PC1]
MCEFLAQDMHFQFVDLQFNQFENQINRVQLIEELEASQVEQVKNAFSNQFYIQPSSATIQKLIKNVVDQYKQIEADELKDNPLVKIFDKNKTLFTLRITLHQRALLKYLELKQKSNMNQLVEICTKQKEVLKNQDVQKLIDYIKNIKNIAVLFQQPVTKPKVEVVVKKVSKVDVKLTQKALEMKLQKQRKKHMKEKQGEKEEVKLSQAEKKVKQIKKAIKNPQMKDSLVKVEQKGRLGEEITIFKAIPLQMEDLGEKKYNVSEDEDLVSEKNSEDEEKLSVDQLLDLVADSTFEVLCKISHGDKRRAREMFIQNQTQINQFCKKMVNDISKGEMKVAQISDVLFEFLNGCDQV